MHAMLSKEEQKYIRKRLKTLGFKTLREYYGSDRWLKTRERFRGGNCTGCEARFGLELHHKTYKRLGREFREDCFWVCRDCHLATHNLMYDKMMRGPEPKYVPQKKREKLKRVDKARWKRKMDRVAAMERANANWIGKINSK